MPDKSQVGTEIIFEGQFGRLLGAAGVKNATELARKLNITPQSVSEFRRQRKLPPGLLIEFCKKNQVSLDWLIFGKEAAGSEKVENRISRIRAALRKMQEEEKPALIPEIMGKVDDLERELRLVRTDRIKFPAIGDGEELPEGFVLVPRYDVAAAAGSGAVIHSEQIVDSLAFRSSWIRELGLKADALALISTRGDSMEPTLHPGDLLLIDLSSGAVAEDAIYAIHNDGLLVVKRVQKMMDGSIIIKSDNPAYKEQTLEKGMLENVRIVGRVVWAGRRL